jgi:hypothetical protein
MSNIINKIYVISLSLVVLLLSVLFFALPDKTYSETENRSLYTKPELNSNSILSGEFSNDFGLYLADQFPFRDNFVGFKAYFELLQGKKENNGVIYAKNDTLIPHSNVSENRLKDNLATIAKFSEKNNLDLSIAHCREPWMYSVSCCQAVIPQRRTAICGITTEKQLKAAA